MPITCLCLWLPAAPMTMRLKNLNYYLKKPDFFIDALNLETIIIDSEFRSLCVHGCVIFSRESAMSHATIFFALKLNPPSFPALACTCSQLCSVAKSALHCSAVYFKSSYWLSYSSTQLTFWHRWNWNKNPEEEQNKNKQKVTRNLLLSMVDRLGKCKLYSALALSRTLGLPLHLLCYDKAIWRQLKKVNSEAKSVLDKSLSAKRSSLGATTKTLDDLVFVGVFSSADIFKFWRNTYLAKCLKLMVRLRKVRKLFDFGQNSRHARSTCWLVYV